jgi:hypothetical protein
MFWVVTLLSKHTRWSLGKRHDDREAVNRE